MIDIDAIEELNSHELGDDAYLVQAVVSKGDLIDIITALRKAEKDAARYRRKSEKYDDILSYASNGSDVAVSIDGDIYHNVSMTYEMAEDAECVSMCLDDAGVPYCDEIGVRYSLWGRVLRFSTYSAPRDEIEAMQCK